MTGVNDKVVLVTGAASGLGLADATQHGERAHAYRLGEVGALEQLRQLLQPAGRRLPALGRAHLEPRGREAAAPRTRERELALAGHELLREGLELRQAEALVPEIEQRAEQDVAREPARRLDVQVSCARRHTPS